MACTATDLLLRLSKTAAFLPQSRWTHTTWKDMTVQPVVLHGHEPAFTGEPHPLGPCCAVGHPTSRQRPRAAECTKM